MDERIIRAKLDHIRQSAVATATPLAGWKARTADHLGPGEYRYDGDWADLAPGLAGAAWPAGKTVFLRATVEAPAAPAGSDLFIAFDIEHLEGMLTVDGRPYAGIDVHHPRVTLPAGRLDLLAEFASVPAALYEAGLRGALGRLAGVSLLTVERGLEAAYYDLLFAAEAAKQAHDERRRQLLAAAVADALLAVDLTASPDQYRREVAAARALLAGRLAAIAPDPEGGRIFLTGHSHIDTAWLWPLRETVRKCGRTFATACRLMERYPDYHFSCSQPQLYEYTRRHYPALYEEIKHWVAAGRWETTGGMWVESDCNVPSGEALIRQVLHGVAFFRDEFGTRPRTCWLPDVFGYPASLPQILAGCGLDNFMTVKLHWQARNLWPDNLFYWEGIDGTRLLAHIPRLREYYNGTPNPEQLQSAWDNFQQKAAYPEVLFPFGYGDGGGGPTETMLEFTERAARYPGLPAARQGRGESYFDAVHAAAPDLPIWNGELYLETHRGTYTTHGDIKRANRKNELLLRDAEIAASLAALAGAPLDAEALHSLRAAWQNLLLLQFHDILPGSSIGMVYREALADHARIAAAAGAVRDQALAALAAKAGAPPEGPGVFVFNSLSWPRADVTLATIPDPGGPVELVGPDGAVVPAQVVARAQGRAQIAFAPPPVPPLGYLTLTPRAAAAPVGARFSVSERAGGLAVESRFFSLDLDGDGCITRLLDRRCDREVVPAGARANELQLFQDGPEREAAWNIHATYAGRAYAWDGGAQIEVVENGPVRLVVRITRRYRDNVVEQDMILYDATPRIDFVTRAVWQERQVLLKAAFPVEVRSPRATYEIQFGAVERPTHRNTSWDQEKFEVCGHRWADLSESGYGVSLLNDCKYGYDALGHVLRLTLLRGPEWPDPDADRGRHEFTYALYPHLGGWAEGETVRRAAELNSPALCQAAPGGSGPARRSFFEVSGPALLDTVKPAEDGDGYILRLYEPHGGRGTVRVAAAIPMGRAGACNLVEEGDEPLEVAGGAVTFAMRPFQIKTLRVRF